MVHSLISHKRTSAGLTFQHQRAIFFDMGPACSNVARQWILAHFYGWSASCGNHPCHREASLSNHILAWKSMEESTSKLRNHFDYGETTLCSLQVRQIYTIIDLSCSMSLQNHFKLWQLKLPADQRLSHDHQLDDDLPWRFIWVHPQMSNMLATFPKWHLPAMLLLAKSRMYFSTSKMSQECKLLVLCEC